MTRMVSQYGGCGLDGYVALNLNGVMAEYGVYSRGGAVAFLSHIIYERKDSMQNFEYSIDKDDLLKAKGVNNFTCIKDLPKIASLNQIEWLGTKVGKRLGFGLHMVWSTHSPSQHFKCNKKVPGDF